MTAKKVVLLLGRRDEPTDGVEDYCHMLRDAAASRGLSFEIVRVQWAEKGWRDAFAELRREAVDWRGRWVLLQFTTLAWSRRGFPLRAPSVLRALRQFGARPGVVFHDFFPLPGKGIVGHGREFAQARALRQIYAVSELGIFTVSVNQVSWLPLHRDKAVFIPVGANCPEVARASSSHEKPTGKKVRSVAVYSITGGAKTSVEIADIACALKRATKSVGPVQLLLFGRGSQEAESSLRYALAEADVQIECYGLLRPEQISCTLSRADALLFVRGQISTRRGSAIAGIACGLPVVCYSGPETAWPVTEAGISAVPFGDRNALAQALEMVLSDTAYRMALAERSRNAQKRYFSWTSIADRFVAELD